MSKSEINKKIIIDKIKELASENNGSAPGWISFRKVTGITESSWRGKIWITWSDAVAEAGLTPNTKHGAFSDEYLLKSLAELTIKINKLPTVAHMKMEKNTNLNFPRSDAFNRLGDGAERIEKLRAFAQENPKFAEIINLLPQPSIKATPTSKKTTSNLDEGFVYLGVLKIGTQRRYKIGKTNLVSRRSNELSLQLPEKMELVHYIKTDDMAGIEKYWHNRFANKNTNGEWFELTADDVKTFKLRKFM